MKQNPDHSSRLPIACILLLAAVLMSCMTSCSIQMERKPESTKLNLNVLSKGHYKDGDLDMAGNAEAAATELGKYGKSVLTTELGKEGIKGASSVGNKALSTFGN